MFYWHSDFPQITGLVKCELAVVQSSCEHPFFAVCREAAHPLVDRRMWSNTQHGWNESLATIIAVVLYGLKCCRVVHAFSGHAQNVGLCPCIYALTHCFFTVVGSILSNLCKCVGAATPVNLKLLVVLVVGTCFFAGGTCFSEQGFSFSACSERTCLLPFNSGPRSC